MKFIFLLLVVSLVVYLIQRFYKMRREHQARYADPPERIFLEVKLPKDMKDAEPRMQNFYRKVKDATSADPGLRREGKRQLEILYVAETPPGSIAPTLSCYIVCDPDKASIVKRSLRSAFNGQASFSEVKSGDPLQDVLNELLESGRSEDEKQPHQPAAPEEASG